MLIDERPSYPMVNSLEVTLRGPVHSEQLRETLPRAIRRHPLLNARIRQLDGRTSEWVPHGDPPELEVIPNDDSIDPTNEFVDLTHGPSFKVSLRPGLQTSTLVLTVHHAACDVQGMLTFLIEWLLIYTGGEDQLTECRLDTLTRREELVPESSVRSLPQRLKSITEYFPFRPPCPLAIPSHSSATPLSRTSGYCTSALSADDLALLQKKSQQRDVTVYDWLIAVMFQTIQNWNVEYETHAKCSPFRLVIPVDRRPQQARFLSACNQIGYKLLTREPYQIASFNELLSSIAAEMEPVRRAPQQVSAFIKMLRVLLRFGVMEQIVRRWACFATVMFSNLGDLPTSFEPLLESHDARLQLGELVVESIRCSAPRQPTIKTTIATFSYAGEQHFVSGSEGRGLDAQQMDQFLERYRRDVLSSLG